MPVRRRIELSRSELMGFLSYSPETGEFRWKKRPSNRAKVGEIAGHVNGQGYREIELRGITYQCNRLAWLFVTGLWPEGEVDHENTIKVDNKFGNLRDCTKAQNQHRSG